MRHTHLMPDVPMVGQKCKVLAAWASAVVECACPAKTVLMLHGKGRVAQCPACERRYGIAKGGQLQIGEVIVADTRTGELADV